MSGSLKAVAACALILVVGLSGCSKSPLDRAQSFVESAMPDEALPLLQIEIQTNPKNTRAHMLLGRALLMKNNLDGASESFGRVVLLDPGKADDVGRYYLDGATGAISQQPARTDFAVSCLQAAVTRTRSLDKEVARVYRRIGIMTERDDALAEAVTLDASLAQDDTVAALHVLGGRYQSVDEARAAAQRFLSGHAGSAMRPQVLVQLGRLELGNGNVAKAREYATEASGAASDARTREAAQALLSGAGEIENSNAQQAQIVAQQQADQAVAEARAAQEQAAAAARNAQAEAQLRSAQARNQELDRAREQAEAERAAAERAAQLEWENWKLKNHVEARISGLVGNGWVTMNGQSDRVVPTTYGEKGARDSGPVDVTRHLRKGPNQFEFRVTSGNFNVAGHLELTLNGATIATRDFGPLKVSGHTETVDLGFPR